MMDFPRMGRSLARLSGLALLVFGMSGAAVAQTVTVSPVCVRQCNAASGTVRSNPPEMQACLIRCNAGQAFERSAGRAAPPPRGAPPGRGTAPVPYGVARPVAPPPREASYAALQGPTGQRLAAAPRENYQPQVRGLNAAALGAAARPGSGRAGAIYLAAPPSAGYGLTFGMADRLGAHGQAERSCQSRGGGSCRLALEFTERCGAVAQAKRSNGLIRTADPSTYTITFAAGGAGGTKETAEAQAVADCRSRDRGATCEVVASGCGG